MTEDAAPCEYAEHINQLAAFLMAMLAERGGHAPDLIPVEVDGGHPLGVAAVAHLVALAVG